MKSHRTQTADARLRDDARAGAAGPEAGPLSGAHVVLVAPPSGGRATGGFLVNRELARAEAVTARDAATPAGLTRAIREARSGQAVVVDSLYLFDNGTAAVLAREALEHPLVLLAHSLPSLLPDGPIGRRRSWLAAEREFLAAAAGAIAPSTFMAHALIRRGLDSSRCSIVAPAPICDGRPPGPATGLAGTEPHLLTVANWSPSKGILEAARALAELEDLPWSWTIVGSRCEGDPYANRVREILERATHRDRTTAVPATTPEKLTPYYREARIFLLPSFMESYGLVYAEALSHGVPVVAYAAAAVPSVVADAGHLVSPASRSRPDPLAHAIRRLLEHGTATVEKRARARAALLPRWQETRDAFLNAARELAGNWRRP